MWQCPKCETLNKYDNCIICGEHKPFEEEKPKVNNVSLTEHKNTQSDQKYINKENIPDYQSSDNKIDPIAVGVGIILIIFAFVVFVFIVYTMLKL